MGLVTAPRSAVLPSGRRLEFFALVEAAGIEPAAKRRKCLKFLGLSS
jgi:hypothetical protein